MTELEEEKPTPATEPNGQDSESDEVDEPEFTCGLFLALRRDGQGVQFQVIEDSQMERKATIQDINMMANHLTDHTRALMTTSQVINALENNKIRKGIGRNLRV